MKTLQAANSTIAKYSRQVTQFAAQKISDELSKMSKTKNTVTPVNEEEFTIEKYTTTLMNCMGDSFCSFLLPCRHILY